MVYETIALPTELRRRRPTRRAGGGNAESQSRTGDTRIFSPLLYQLSYLGRSGPDGIRTRDLMRDRHAR
jgi:hypothetical protein